MVFTTRNAAWYRRRQCGRSDSSHRVREYGPGSDLELQEPKPMRQAQRPLSRGEWCSRRSVKAGRRVQEGSDAHHQAGRWLKESPRINPASCEAREVVSMHGAPVILGRTVSKSRLVTAGYAT